MKGILFQPDNIRAIEENRKTVTRRLAGLKEISKEPGKWFFLEEKPGGQFLFGDLLGKMLIIKPLYRVGDVVYIKEAWAVDKIWEDKKPSKINSLASVWYPLNADLLNIPLWVGKMRSPMFLPEKFARYFIKITDVRPERFNLLGMTSRELELEGGQEAVKYLNELDGKWVWFNGFKKVENKKEVNYGN